MYIENLFRERTSNPHVYCDEFVYIKIPDKNFCSSEDVRERVEHLASMSKQLYLSFENELHGLDPDELLHSGKAKWFGFNLDLVKEDNVTDNKFNVFTNVDKDAINRFMIVRKQFKYQGAVIPEVSFSSEYSLGPTIYELFQTFHLPFLFIRVEGRPDDLNVRRIKEAFEYLRMRGFKGKIYYNLENPYWREWNAKTLNTFSGLSTVHIDLSNKCTHSCVFCGLWGPDFIEEAKKAYNNVIDDRHKNYMNRQMDRDKALSILSSLPFTVSEVQFGGAGDPLTHPNWLEILSKWRSKGVTLEVLTNFEYPSREEIEILHELARGNKSFRFIINVAAASPEIYKKVRPRQTTATFEKVISNIQYATELKRRDGEGLDIVMLQILNVYNYHESIEMVELAHKLGVDLWFKPLEVHSPIHKKFTIPIEKHEEFKDLMGRILIKAHTLGVRLVLKNYLEKIAGVS